MNRVILRSLEKHDLLPVLEMLQDPEVMHFLGPRRALEYDEAMEWFNNELESPSRYVVALSDTNEFIGFCGIKNLDGVMDFGYFFRKSFWGKGFGTEACKLALSKLEDEVDLAQVKIFIAKANESSLAIARKLGWKKQEETIKENEQGFYFTVSM